MSTENGVNPPAPNPAHNSNFSLLSVLGRERLTGPNYMDWMRNLRFTLRYENKEYVLDEQIPTIDDDSTQEEIEAHQKHYDDANKVSCIMASSMSPELQKTFENTWAYKMKQQLKEMFQAKAGKERLDVVKSLMACKPKPRASICAFVLEMKLYFEQIPTFDDDSTQEEIEAHQKHYDDANKVACIMASSMSPELQKTFENTWAYKMKQQLKEMFQAKTGKERLDVVKSLICHTPPRRNHEKGKAAKGKSDRGSKRKAESEIAPTSDPKEAVCFYCNTKGHWKRSCPKYLKDLKDGKVEKGSHSGMFMIELHNTTTSDLWVLDTGCGTYICIILQGINESRRLKHGELNLVMGNRKITPVTRIGKYELMLKSGVRIDLNNCCYSSEMTRNIISFHALFKDGYKFSFDNENGDILVYSNGCFMFKASPCEGIYETIECISHNGNVILNVGSSNELDKSKLWHSRLGHVNKKHIIQLQKDGVLESFDFKLDDVCESCLLGKMTKSPFKGSCKRDEGLLDFGKRPSLGHIKIWGCEVFVTREAQDKLEARSEKYLFIGYLEESFGYLFYQPKDNVVFVARRGVFLEREMISKEDSRSKIDREEIQETSSRVRKPSQDPQFYYGFHIEEDKISDSTLTKLNEPTNYKEAMAIPKSAKWKEAMKSEIQSMYDNQV
ncbi:retrotransposon protein, putative, ty1-copia subclass [Tanacetum coccineum]